MTNPEIRRYDDSIDYKVWKNKKGQYHREGGPAVIYYYPSGKVETEYYYLNNSFHNENGGAHIFYYESGEIKLEQFYLYYKKFNSLKELQDYNKTLILS